MSQFQQYRPARHTLFPTGVKNLIIINVILFLAKLFAESKRMDLDVMLGLFHPFCEQFHFYQYISSLFMHADITHLGYNMVGVWLFGFMLENALGTKRFLIFYLICGLGASVIFQIWTSFEQYQISQELGYTMGFWQNLAHYPPCVCLIGASGAVFGLLMGSALLFPNSTLPYIGFFAIPIKIKWMALLYGGMELWRIFQHNPNDNTAHLAHIGGMIFGFIMIKVYSKDRSSFY
jgi:membrane associated rhomboid family serine protease